jgi:dolichol-phosphate mannosyltransferase
MSATSIISYREACLAPATRSRGIAQPCSRHKLALVIPTYREAQNIRLLLGRLSRVFESLQIDYEILVVDDDSCDGTAEIVEAIARQDPRVRLLVRKGQRGLSGAVLHGWAHTDAAIVGVIDADLQHPPELLAELALAVLSDCDLAIASRYAIGGKVCGWDPIRRLLSAAAILATWPIQRNGLRVSDPMSGFFLVRRECLLGISFQRSGFKLLLEILVRARISSLREVPFALGHRFRGTSKANMKIALDYGRLLVRLYRDKFNSGRLGSSAHAIESAGTCRDPELM